MITTSTTQSSANQFTQAAMTEAQQRAYDQAQVMLAFSQGKKVECRGLETGGKWMELTIDPGWTFSVTEYRIAPTPQEVWLWVKEGKAAVVVPEDQFSTGACIVNGYTKKLFREVINA